MSDAEQIEIEKALAKLDGSGSDSEWAAVEFLRRSAGDRLPHLLLAKYRTARKAGERSSCVYHATRYSRSSADAVQLGREALSDRSSTVRYRACLLLAYAQNRGAIGDLRAAMLRSPKSREDIAAAIDAIESCNHHYFVDRDHSGKVKLNIQ